MLTIHRGTGFEISFDNGIRIGVHFGENDHCTNGLQSPQRYYSDNAEVAIIDEKNHEGFITHEYLQADKGTVDDVIGYVKPDQIAEIIAWCIAYR